MVSAHDGNDINADCTVTVTALGLPVMLFFGLRLTVAGMATSISTYLTDVYAGSKHQGAVFS